MSAHTPDYAALRCAAEHFAPTAVAALDDHAKARAAIAKARGGGK